MAICTTDYKGTRSSVLIKSPAYNTWGTIAVYYGHSVPEHVTHLREETNDWDLHTRLKWRTKAGNTGEMIIRQFDMDAKEEDIKAAIVAMKLTD